MTAPPPAPRPMAAPVAPPPGRPPWSWYSAVGGLAVEVVVTGAVLVSLFLDAIHHGRESAAKGGPVRDGFLDSASAVVYVIGAFVVFVLLVLLLLAVLLTVRRAGGSAGLVIGTVLQVPVLWAGIGGESNGVGIGETVALVAVVAVVVGVVCPPTWRHARARRPQFAPR